MMVVPEGGSLYEDEHEHGRGRAHGHRARRSVAHLYDDVVQLWPKSKVGYTPTLIVGYGGLWGEEYWYAHSNVWETNGC
jgi:hypothetical protein